VSTPAEIFHRVHRSQFETQTGHLRNIVLYVLCIELAEEVDELDQSLEATNRNNMEPNRKYINYLFHYILLYILEFEVSVCQSLR